MNLETLILPLALAGALIAQEPRQAHTREQAHDDAIGVPTLTHVEGTLRASGRDYEATFRSGRMEFLPELGRAAPTDQTFAFAFESAMRGPTAITGRTSGEAQAYGLTATIQRPGAIREQYEVRHEGLKQSFVFGEEIGSHGDLVVRGRIETPLPFQGENAGGGLSFVHPVWGGVELGKVLGFDANGDTVLGSMSFDGEMLEMSLPASFVDDAAWPITLDPEIGAGFSGNVDQFDARAPAASTNAAGEVLLVFHRQFSLESAGVRAQRLNADGTANGGVLFLSASAYASDPAVGYNRQLDNWLVAYEARAANLLDPADILAVAVQPDGVISPTFDVATGPANQHSIDIASDGSGTDNECMIVWVEDQGGLRARETWPLITGPAAFPEVIVTTDSTDANPAISQNTGPSSLCMLVFERGTTVRGTWITINSQVRGNSVLIANIGSNPDCDADGLQGLVVYQAPEGGTFLKNDVYARCYDLGSMTPNGPAVALDDSPNKDAIEPAVGFLGPNALVMWASEFSAPLVYDVLGIAVDMELCTTCGTLASSRRLGFKREHKPLVTSRYSADTAAASQDCMFFWLEQLGSSGFLGDIYGRRYTATGTGGTKSTIANGCGLGGNLTSPSPVSLGTDLVLNVTNADPAATAGFLLLRDPGTPLISCGLCRSVSPGVTLPAANLNTGSFSFTIRIPCDNSLFRGEFDWQGVVLGTGQSPCLFAPGAGFTNILRTEIRD